MEKHVLHSCSLIKFIAPHKNSQQMVIGTIKCQDMVLSSQAMVHGSRIILALGFFLKTSYPLLHSEFLHFIIHFSLPFIEYRFFLQ